MTTTVTTEANMPLPLRTRVTIAVRLHWWLPHLMGMATYAIKPSRPFRDHSWWMSTYGRWGRKWLVGYLIARGMRFSVVKTWIGLGVRLLGTRLLNPGVLSLYLRTYLRLKRRRTML